MVKHVAGGEPDAPGDGERPRRRIPEATVARLPLYLRSLLEAAEAKTTTVSSERLAEMAGVNAAKVRKDLSYLGSYGTRGVGYDVEYLLFQISRELGLTQDWPVVIVGIGNLGHALANYKGFSERGFRVAALVDSDPSKRGEAVGRERNLERGGRRRALHRGVTDFRVAQPRFCRHLISHPNQRIRGTSQFPIAKADKALDIAVDFGFGHRRAAHSRAS